MALSPLAYLSPKQLGTFFCRITIERMLAEQKLAVETNPAKKMLLVARIDALADVAIWLDLALDRQLVGHPPELSG